MKNLNLIVASIVLILPSVVLGHPGHGSHEYSSIFHPSLNLYLIILTVVVFTFFIFRKDIKKAIIQYLNK